MNAGLLGAFMGVLLIVTVLPALVIGVFGRKPLTGARMGIGWALALILAYSGWSAAPESLVSNVVALTILAALTLWRYRSNKPAA